MDNEPIMLASRLKREWRFVSCAHHDTSNVERPFGQSPVCLSSLPFAVYTRQPDGQPTVCPERYSSSFYVIMQEARVYATHATTTPGEMNMASKLGAECPCGFTFATPHGQDDAVAVLQLHIDRIHKSDYPQGISRAEAITHLREAN
jgi:hypothetical protein